MVNAWLLAESTAAAATLTADRAVASSAALVALTGVLAGGFALTRSAGRGVRRSSSAAVVAGLVGVVVGLLVVAAADGGPGTGNGVVGGYAGVACGLLAVLLGGLALRRSRRPAGDPRKPL